MAEKNWSESRKSSSDAASALNNSAGYAIEDNDLEDALKTINNADESKRSSTTRVEPKNMLFTR